MEIWVYVSFIQTCNNLRTLRTGLHLTIWFDLVCGRITDEGLCDLALGLGTGLRELALQRCVHITDQGVQILLQKCNKMAFLSLSECAGLSEACFFNDIGDEGESKEFTEIAFR
eukprot:Lankesteria_metandrocarpae@DN4874_c0_g1_i2.p2